MLNILVAYTQFQPEKTQKLVPDLFQEAIFCQPTELIVFLNDKGKRDLINGNISKISNKETP